MPVIAADGEVFHLSVGDLDADWVAAFVEFGDHAQARCCSGGADEAQDRLVTGQGSALPVPGDLREQAVLDLVPFAGARLGGIVAPLLVGGLAGTALGWRFAFVVGAAIVAVAVAVTAAVRIPPWLPNPSPGTAGTSTRSGWLTPTLVVVFAVVALEFSLSFWLASYLNDSVGLPRTVAAAMVAGLYAANLAGRLVASRLAHRMTAARLLAVSIGVGLAGMPILLAATDAAEASVGIALVGVGIGATFPLTSSLHVAASSGPADTAVGQVLVVAAIGQILGPSSVAEIAQTAGLRIGLLILPTLALLAAGALARHHANTR